MQRQEYMDLLGSYRTVADNDNLNEIKIILKSAFLRYHLDELDLKIPYSHYVNPSPGKKHLLKRRLQRMLQSYDGLVTLLRSNIRHKMGYSKLLEILGSKNGLIDQIQDLLQIIYE